MVSLRNFTSYPFAVGSATMDRGFVGFPFHRLTSFLIFTHKVEERARQKEFPPSLMEESIFLYLVPVDGYPSAVPGSFAEGSLLGPCPGRRPTHSPRYCLLEKKC